MRVLIQWVVFSAVVIANGACSNVKFSGSSNSGATSGATACTENCGTAPAPTWFQSGFNTPCSKPCGGGSETQTVECRDGNNVVVADTQCKDPKPESSRSCNVQACTGNGTWNIGPWGTECSKTCGGGVKTRTVVCQNNSGAAIAESNCPQPKPDTTMVCNPQACPPVAYDWFVVLGLCSKECGGGTAQDTVSCQRNDGVTVAESFCNASTKPASTRACNTQACPAVYTYDWEPQPWSTCSKTCGSGLQTRAIACKRNDGGYVSENLCDPAKKPVATQACNTQNCPVGNKVQQKAYVSPASSSVDVILIIDDSSSMKEDQAKLAARMSNLLADLDALKIDYQVCLTTTDVNYYKGSPIKWSGLTDFVMTKSTPNKSQVFMNTINALGAEWSSDERGIYALNLMVRDFKGTGCFRPQATLSAILISDEDERSVGGLSNLSGVQYKPLEPMDLPDNLISNIQTSFNSTGFVKPFIWNSIVVKPGDSACMKVQDAQSSPSFYGNIYSQLTSKTAGYLGSICDADYTQNLKFIKDRTVNSMPGITLQCIPLDNPAVTFDKPIVTTVSLTGNTIKFTPAVPEGVNVTIDYTCP